MKEPQVVGLVAAKAGAHHFEHDIVAWQVYHVRRVLLFVPVLVVHQVRRLLQGIVNCGLLLYNTSLILITKRITPANIRKGVDLMLRLLVRVE